MLSIKKILFPTDFSECADSALTMALLLAKNFEAELDMLHAVVLHGDDVGEEVYSRFPDLDKCVQLLVDNADSRLEKTIEDRGRLTLRHTVRRGVNVTEEILRFADEEDTDLIVMGTHGRRGIRKVLLGSVTASIVRRASCPVLTIRSDHGRNKKTDIKRLLLPTDLSSHSALSARYANVLAKVMGARLDVVHVIDDSVHPAFMAAGLDTPSKIDSDVIDRAKASVEEHLSDAGVTMPHNVIIEEGSPDKKIIKVADEEPNTLIVIASHGHSALERLLLGSTTDRVIRMANVPVLTVKHGERDFVT